MESPTEPTIPMTRPETTNRIADFLKRQITNGESIAIISPSYIGDTLAAVGLDVDADGFIVRAETGDYAVPKGFSPSVFRETDTVSDNPLVDYFVTTDGTDEPFIRERSRLHITDLHSVTTGKDTVAYPIPDDMMMLDELHQKVGIAFSAVTSWSDGVEAVTRFVDEDARVRIDIPAENEIHLSCFSPRCSYESPASEWAGTTDDPRCPECGESWTSDVTVCLDCQNWHRGTHYEGDAYYTTPSCPDCGADTDRLDIQTRYTDFSEKNSLMESKGESSRIPILD